MFINHLARDTVVVLSGLVMVAIARELRMEVGWLLVGVPTAALLPVFMVAGATRSYRNAVVAIRIIQGFAVLPLVIVLWESWPFAIPQVITCVLGFSALATPGDEARVAGSVAAVSLVPAMCGLLIAPGHPATLLAVSLFVCGLVWFRTARSKSPIPRAFVVSAAGRQPQEDMS
jgi:hypothetical protein